MTNKEQIQEYLNSLPSKWKDKLTDLLCQILTDKNKPSCEDVRDCETVTSLSPFTVSGTTASIKYTDENGVQVTRSFDVNTLLSNTLDGIDPECLASEEQWLNLTYVERIQLLISSQCDCCNTTTTSTTTTTTIP